MDKFPEIVGLQEVVKMVGFGKARVYQLLADGRFPPAKYTLRCGRIWLRTDIYAFLEDWDRVKLGPGGRKPSSEDVSTLP